MSRFFFAWVEPEETAFLPAHEREDERIYRLAIAQQEGEFAQAEIEIRNPMTGLLNPGRKQWAWLAWQDEDTAEPLPLFFGRLVGLPEDPVGGSVTLLLEARPRDWEAQRAALAATLKEFPYWDPVFVAPDQRDNPDSVLEARSARWHVDRVTHALTVSDIAAGEDGVIDLGGDLFADSVEPRHQQVPGRMLRLEASVQWTQAAAGTVDLTAALLAVAKAGGAGNGRTVESFTGDGLARDWPARGDRIGAGWTVGDSEVRRGDGLWIPREDERTIFADASFAEFRAWGFAPTLKVDYAAARSRTERLAFTLEADIQAMVTDAGTDDTILVTLASTDLAEPIDDPDASAGGTAPIGDPRRRSYFQTDRGHRSLEYLIALARARLIHRARAVEITCKTRWQNGLALSCRKNLRLAHPALPGGEATGKITGYSLLADGAEGTLEATVTVGCMVGRGATVAAAPGTPDYVEDGYVEDGYQTRTGQLIMPIAGEVTYAEFSGQATPDDGIDFLALTPARVVQSFELFNGKEAQREVLRAFRTDLQAAIAALNQVPTAFRLVLAPLNAGPFETEYAVAVSALSIPKTIDLEAV